MKNTLSNYPLSDQVTQVLLAFNCANWIDKTISHLLETGLPIIAVDNGSTDATVEHLRKYPQVKTIVIGSNIGAAARNEAVKAATTPYIAFCDDDTWYERDGLVQAAKLFDKYDKLSVITGTILIGDKNKVDDISTEMSASPLVDRFGLPGSVLTSFMGGASVVRKDAFLQCGGYDPRFFIGGEEEHLAWTMLHNGWQMRYIPAVIVHHHPSLANFGSIAHFGLRNTIWTAWLHRPAARAAGWTWEVVRKTKKDRTFAKGMYMAIKGMPWVLKERRVLPAQHEADIQLLRSGAAKTRRYGTSQSNKAKASSSASKATPKSVH